jgi:hypothetical protein
MKEICTRGTTMSAHTSTYKPVYLRCRMVQLCVHVWLLAAAMRPRAPYNTPIPLPPHAIACMTASNPDLPSRHLNCSPSNRSSAPPQRVSPMCISSAQMCHAAQAIAACCLSSSSSSSSSRQLSLQTMACVQQLLGPLMPVITTLLSAAPDACAAQLHTRSCHAIQACPMRRCREDRKSHNLCEIPARDTSAA